jgi:hypothetical protein
MLALAGDRGLTTHEAYALGLRQFTYLVPGPSLTLFTVRPAGTGSFARGTWKQRAGPRARAVMQFAR